MNGKAGHPHSDPHATFAETTFTGAARASIVNRTRRIVREQAVGMQKQRQKTRSLWLPVTICSILLLITCYAGWALLDSYDLTYNGVLDASYQTLVFLAWSLPVTILIIGLIWKQRTRTHSNGGI